MSTDAQIEANRTNSTKSTGPTSEAGKARSARNSIRHGAYARIDPITSGILGEDIDEIQALADGVVRDLDLRNTLEYISAVSIAARKIGQLRVSRLIRPLVEGVQMTLEENQSDDEHRREYEFAHELLTALNIADNYDEGTDISSVDWFTLERQLWLQVETDPDLKPSRPVFVDADGNRRQPIGDEQWLANFIHTVNQRFESFDQARGWAEELFIDHEPGAYEETRRLNLAEAQRVMAELERVAALQERTDRGVARGLAAHKSIRSQTSEANMTAKDPDDNEPDDNEPSHEPAAEEE